MNCPICKIKYNHDDNIPRLLVQCGHSLCEGCISDRSLENTIECPDCKKVSTFTSVQEIPKNLALLNAFDRLQTKNRSRAPSVKKESKKEVSQGINELCKIHNSNFEAFCKETKQMMCITCILGAQKESYTLLTIEQGFEDEKSHLLDTELKLEELNDRINQKLKEIDEHLIKSKNVFKEKQITVENYFNNFLEIITKQKEASLKLLREKMDGDNKKVYTLERALDDQKTELSELITKIGDIKSFEAKPFLMICPVLYKDISLSLRDIKDEKLELDLPDFKPISETNHISAQVKTLVKEEAKKRKVDSSEIESPLKKVHCTEEEDSSLKNAKAFSKASRGISKRDRVQNKVGKSQVGSKRYENPLDKSSRHEKSGVEKANKRERTRSYLGNKRGHLKKKTTPQDKNYSVLGEKRQAYEDPSKITSNIAKKTLSKMSRGKTEKENSKPSDGSKASKERYNKASSKYNFQNKRTAHLSKKQSKNVNNSKEDLNSLNNSKKTPKSIKSNKNLNRSKLNEYGVNPAPSKPSKINSYGLIRNLEKERALKKAKKAGHSSKIMVTPEKPGYEGIDTSCSMNKKMIVEDFTDTKSIKLEYINFSSIPKAQENMIYLVGGYGTDPTHELPIIRYSPKSEEYHQLDLHCERVKSSSLILQSGKIWLIGGKSRGQRLATILEVDPKLQVSNELELRLKRAKCGAGVVQVHDKIFIIGGNSGEKILNEVEIIDLNTMTSKIGPSLNIARDEMGVSLGIDGNIYVLGGFGGSDHSYLSSVERLNLNTMKWEEIAPMKTSRRSMCTITLPDGIYCSGGFDGDNYLKVVEKYDEDSQTWNNVSPMKIGRCFASACVSSNNQYIYMFGGYNGDPLDSVERYSVILDRWEPLAPMPFKRFMHSSQLYNGDVTCLEDKL